MPHPPPVSPAAPREPVAQFSSGVQLVEVYATVVDAKGEPVSGLPRDAFEVYEDGQRQTVQAFAAGDFPLSAAVAIDRSASMAGERLERAKLAARAFLDALRPDDQAAIISISGRVEELAPLSTDRRAQREAIDGLTPWSTTALHDAIIEAIDLVQGGSGRRALVLLSDGQDRYSARTLDEALDRARRSDALVYPIALGRATTPLFPRLASLTGGRSFHAANPRGLEAILTGIARELREQYLIGYTPARPPSPEGEPEWHSIEVRVREPGLRVRARDGYYGH
ncbi:MAG TPA: VWA domain-containing protein [Vicinamibacterales bacterium]|nr:VWA domain-containing protein [Vicinamibacterales bacterium]